MVVIVVVVVVVAVFVNVVAVIVFRAGRPPNGPLSPCHLPKDENTKAGVLMSNDDRDPNNRSRLWVIRLSKKKLKGPSLTVVTVKGGHYP